jgi:hypothetical protein
MNRCGWISISVGLTLHATASLLACPAEAVRSQALELIRAHLTPGETVSAGTTAVRLAEESEGGITLHASALAVEMPDLQDLTLALRLQSRDQAASILRERFGASAVRGVAISPAWAPMLPLFPYQIQIVAGAE